MTTALLDDAAERRIRELMYSWASETWTVEYTVRTAWTEATEVAALKCDAIERENIEWIKRSGEDVVLSDGYKHADGAADGAAACAAAIRGGKL